MVEAGEAPDEPSRGRPAAAVGCHAEAFQSHQHGCFGPLVSRGAVLGVVAAVRTPGQPAFAPADRDLLADLARRAGVALDNARLFGERTRIAAHLQESLLPASSR